MRPTIAFFDIQTGETTVREMNDEEYAEALKEQKEAEAKHQAEAERLAARNSAKAKLAALGLSEEEVAALIG